VPGLAGGVDDVDVAGVADLDGLDFLLQHGQVLGDIEADEQHADDLAAAVLDRIVLGDVLLAEQRGQADVVATGAQQRVAWVRVVELGADGAFAVFFFSEVVTRTNSSPLAAKMVATTPVSAVNLSGMLEVQVQRLPLCLSEGVGLPPMSTVVAVSSENCRRRTGREQTREARRVVHHGGVEHFHGIADAAR
jgi:hypothetical protein